MSEWSKLFGASDSPYELPLGLEEGSVFKVPPPYPDAKVKAVIERYPRRIIIQQVDLEASAEEDRKVENIRVFTVILETEDGQQIELHRWAAPVEELEAPVVDLTTCESCGGKIFEGQAVEIDGHAYHKRCVTEDSDEDRAVCAVRNRNGGIGDPIGSDGDERGNEEDDKEDGSASKASSTTITRTRITGKSVSHLVTITKFGNDSFMTSLWSSDNGNNIGMAHGIWRAGLFDGEIPRNSDVEYIDGRFFKGAGVATKSDLRVWNRLYMEAIREVDPPF